MKKTRQKVFKVAISWAKDIESWLTNYESRLIWKVDWQGKLIDEGNWLMKKVDWWGKYWWEKEEEVDIK